MYSFSPGFERFNILLFMFVSVLSQYIPDDLKPFYFVLMQMESFITASI